jgi:hypothetical protein
MTESFKPAAGPIRHAARMPADIDAAAQFVHTHGRLLERRRFEHLFVDPDPDAVVDAVAAYRNADHGFGLMEPDLRTPTSQPSAVLYALEILEEAGATDTPMAGQALDWLQTVTNPDGGVPFVLATARGHAHAPWWAPQDDPPSSLLMTAGIVAAAYNLDLAHPWLGTATAHVWSNLKDVKLSDPYTFRYAVQFLDAVPDSTRADAELGALSELVPADGVLRVEAGVEGETLGALEIATRPGHAGRRLFPDELIEHELTELAGAQQDDGGWDFTWAAWNPAVAFEWRGMVTVEALKTLSAYGLIKA